jgi:hypothetical protein
MRTRGKKANSSKSSARCSENPETLANMDNAGCAAAQNRYFRRTAARAEANREMNIE